MSWTAPMTWVSNQVLTAPQLNLHLRDNLLETMPAKATVTSQFFAAKQRHLLVERSPGGDQFDNAVEYTNSEEYTDLATYGPTVTRTCGPMAMVVWGAQLTNDGESTRNGAAADDDNQTAVGFCALQVNRVDDEAAAEDGGEGSIWEASDAHAVIRRGQDNGTPPAQIFTGTHHILFTNLGTQSDDNGQESEESQSEALEGEYEFVLKYRSTGGYTGFSRQAIFVWPLS